MADDPKAPGSDRHGIRSWVRAARRRLALGGVTRRPSSPGAALSAVFGPLELEVLEVLWRRAQPLRVRDLQEHFPVVAYTTLMTTLDRLFKKGVLQRVKHGRAFHYAPRFDRHGLQVQLAADAFETWLVADAPKFSAIRPLMSCFVDAVSRRDMLLLEELEAMVRARKRQRRRGPDGADSREPRG
jgi:predicted transcriptional regulator